MLESHIVVNFVIIW